MRKLILLILFVFILSVNAYSATVTTDGDGTDWNTGANWDTGNVPTVDDDAVTNHVMSVTATGATFSTLDNNSTITLTGDQTWTIKDAGSIDNAGGEIDCDDNDIDWSITASVGTTRWSWQLDSGTWDVGSGETHFAHGYLIIEDSYENSTTQGHTFFGENCWVTDAFGASAWTMYDMTIDEGVTLRLGTDANSFRILNIHDLTAKGTSVNHITIDDQGGRGWLQIQGNDSSTIDIAYIDSNDGAFGFYINSVDTVAGDSFTASNLTGTNAASDGIYIANCNGTLTFSDCSVSLNSRYGAYLLSTTDSLTLNFNDFEGFSNGSGCFNIVDDFITLNVNRSKIYSNTLRGLVISATLDTSSFALINCLVRENTWEQIYLLDNDDCSMKNCTIADGGATQPNVYVDLDTGGYSFDITSCIISGAKYGINSVGDSEDPTVTYTDTHGGTTANYNGMTDPTGNNGNISVAPAFTDAVGDDYSITTSSPCIGVAILAGSPADDINGDTRPMPLDTRPDMGAYEEQTERNIGSFIISIN